MSSNVIGNRESLELGRELKDRLEDVWDGSALKPLCTSSRYFEDKHHLALTLNTDGVPLYKSSAVSIWPVYMVILNLPAHVWNVAWPRKAFDETSS